MKNFQLLTFALLIFSTVNAQNDRPVKPRGFQSPKIFVIPPGSANIKNVYAFGQDNKATFLYNTGQGKVYKLPMDNMRCLVPDVQSNMPVYKGLPQELVPGIGKQIVPVPMPNPIPKTEIITTPSLPAKYKP